MGGRTWWRRFATGGTPSTRSTAAELTERVGAVRARLAALEVQQLDLLADESVPGRKRRLDAVRDARRDLEEELAGLLDGAEPGSVTLRAGR